MNLDEDGMENRFDCGLQLEAIYAMDNATKKCLPEMLPDPPGRTGFYYSGNPVDGVKSWLGEMHKNKVNAPGWENDLKYQNINKNYFNLVRANTSGIGCAARLCGPVKKLYCLTDNP
ncbi:hypothetical protein Y032_0489g2374 [Ancylostoma ceylanicum]|uniref:SCP domain-containing protein n=3 Tax=Ancylostoma ceylanicum TaxID=53326 RepID=A0A016WUW8_9BILA|nr:hypothetical protein Y032_0489g2374 [Ancylostoma ceylanicum]